MEFKQLEAYVAVVDYNSFSEAAKHLYLTQPTISAHIHSLEQELNSKLIIRTTKKLTVTERGRQLYDCAVNMLNMRNTLVEEFTGTQKKIIDLSVSTIPSSYLLPELLSAFGQSTPNVYFHAMQSDSQGAVARVMDGSVDLGLVGTISSEDSLCFVPFCQDHLVIATPVTPHYLSLLPGLPPKSHKASDSTLTTEKKPVSITDFLNEPFIMRESGSGTKKEIDRYLESQKISPDSLNIVARMNDLESIRKSIASGLGVSILSSRSAKDLADSRQILLFPLDVPSAVRTFYIVYSKNRILKPHVKQFIQFVQDFYKGQQ